MTQVKTTTSKFLDLVVTNDNKALDGSSLGLMNLPDGWVNASGITPPTRVVIVTLKNSNPQNFKVVRKTIELKSPPKTISAAGYEKAILAELKNLNHKSFWSNSVENVSNFQGSKCKLDLDLSHRGSDCMLVLCCQNSRRCSNTTFIPNDPISPDAHPLMEKALFYYEGQKPIMWRPKLLNQSGGHDSIITFCRKAKGGQHSFAVGLRIEDKHSKVTYTTDIVIDPKIQND